MTGSGVAVVRPLAHEDVADVARALARAFLADPVMRHIFPRDGAREAQLTGFFDLFGRRVYLGMGESYAADDLSAGALWAPPRGWQVPLWTIARSSPALLRIFGRNAPRALRTLRFMESHHPREPHYYLAFMGVDPAAQGRGLGSALLRHALERCDARGAPAYLEATSAENRLLYSRHGFEDRPELRLPGGPTVWPMWRAPRPSRTLGG